MTTATPTKPAGLEGIIAGDSDICAVNQTSLIYRGYEIADLAANATFEEVAFLLLVGHKPTAAELDAFKKELIHERAIPDHARDVIKRCALGDGMHPMDVLRTGVSYLAQFDKDCQDNSPEAELRKAKRLLAKIPTIIGHMQNVIDGRDFVLPDKEMGHAANLLYMMTGRKPTQAEAHIVDVSLILYAEHDFNASTFTSRVIAGTLSDMHGCVTGAIAALKGPLHGGANEMAMELLREIGTLDNVEEFMDNAFTTKRKIMGFGHRVYKNGDHRAGILHKLGRAYADDKGGEPLKWFEIGEKVQSIMETQKNIKPNVDFPCGMTYYALGIPVPQYTPIFVASRITGWCAHVMEQHKNNRLIRPLSHYTGPELRKWNG
ncbi:MAG: citrate synthase [Phycisphaeraceae bacterium]|nr:citrate synthase [Phycisphaeraceae bacterium]MCB9848049.1 citrate synthase [Phycisphaeraceae bacterium]